MSHTALIVSFFAKPPHGINSPPTCYQKVQEGIILWLQEKMYWEKGTLGFFQVLALQRAGREETKYQSANVEKQGW